MGQILIRFIKTDGLITDLICDETDSLFDHAEFGTSQGTWVGAHAGSGVQERAADYCVPQRERVYALPCTDAQEAALLQAVRAKIGTPYNYADIVGLLLHDRAIDDRKAVICSQFVFTEVAAVGILLLNCLPAYGYLVTPETLHLSPLFCGRCIQSVGM